eukprot:5293436-Pleurochrysis_carterae.AAC.1
MARARNERDSARRPVERDGARRRTTSFDPELLLSTGIINEEIPGVDKKNIAETFERDKTLLCQKYYVQRYAQDDH